jgi:hypothetical protein
VAEAVRHTRLKAASEALSFLLLSAAPKGGGPLSQESKRIGANALAEGVFESLTLEDISAGKGNNGLRQGARLVMLLSKTAAWHAFPVRAALLLSALGERLEALLRARREGGPPLGDCVGANTVVECMGAVSALIQGNVVCPALLSVLDSFLGAFARDSHAQASALPHATASRLFSEATAFLRATEPLHVLMPGLHQLLFLVASPDALAAVSSRRLAKDVRVLAATRCFDRCEAAGAEDLTLISTPSSAPSSESQPHPWLLIADELVKRSQRWAAALSPRPQRRAQGQVHPEAPAQGQARGGARVQHHVAAVWDLHKALASLRSLQLAAVGSMPDHPAAPVMPTPDAASLTGGLLESSAELTMVLDGSIRRAVEAMAGLTLPGTTQEQRVGHEASFARLSPAAAPAVLAQQILMVLASQEALLLAHRDSQPKVYDASLALLRNLRTAVAPTCLGILKSPVVAHTQTDGFTPQSWDGAPLFEYSSFKFTDDDEYLDYGITRPSAATPSLSFIPSDADASGRDSTPAKQKPRHPSSFASAFQMAVSQHLSRVCSVYGLRPPSEEHMTPEGFSLDLFWPDLKCGIEIDGQLHFAPSSVQDAAAAFDRLAQSTMDGFASESCPPTLLNRFSADGLRTALDARAVLSRHGLKHMYALTPERWIGIDNNLLADMTKPAFSVENQTRLGVALALTEPSPELASGLFSSDPASEITHDIKTWHIDNPATRLRQLVMHQLAGYRLLRITRQVWNSLVSAQTRDQQSHRDDYSKEELMLPQEAQIDAFFRKHLMALFDHQGQQQ